MPAGRKSPIEDWITEDGLILLEGYARDGLSNQQIAEKMGISQSTFYNWCSSHSEIMEAIKKGKAPVDTKVENQVLKSALGYFVTLKKPIKVRTKKTKPGVGTVEEEHIEYVDEQQYIPPVPAAQFFWLKNRRPDKWRDKQEIVTTNADTNDGFIDALNEKAATDWSDHGDETEESDV